MSDNDNPYRAPETTAQTSVPENDMYLPDPIREPMLKTVPWKRFLAIMGFIGSGFMALFGIIFLAGFSAFGSDMGMPGFGAGMGAFMGLIYIGIAVLYLFPSIYLFRDGSALKSYKVTGASEDLVKSVTNGSKFWKFVGIYAILVLAIVPIMMIIGIASAAVSGF